MNSFKPIRNVAVFTDLDGTLLDEKTYSFEAARPALAALREKGCLLVPCTSKTSEETFPLQDELGGRDPFIVENGGAAYCPSDWYGLPSPGQGDRRDWIRLELGIPYHRLIDFIERMREERQMAIVGFHDLSAEEIARECGLTRDQARRAKAREYDEPFYLHPPVGDKIQALMREAAMEGLAVTRGGRFYHLSGGSDKGKAVRLLARIVRSRVGETTTVGIGDSPNDIPMLENVDVPVIVQRPGGVHHPDLVRAVPCAILAGGVGPEGWNEAVTRVLRDLEHP